MRTVIHSCLYISLLLLPLLARADTEIAGIHVQDDYALDGSALILNGAGVRSKFFVKVYVGALYLPEKTQSAMQALDAAGPKSMQMFMLYKKVEAQKITAGWDEGFRKNLDKRAFATLSDRLAQFNALFPDLRKGDRVYMDYTPGKGTQVRINDEQRGHIPGPDFYQALMKVWLGDKPADTGLKKGLLGQ